MDQVSISQVVTGYFCPVRLYLERFHTTGESPRYTISKQVSYYLGKPLQSELLWEEVLAVRPDIDADMRKFLDECVNACREKNWRRPVQTDVQVQSERLGIRGMVDKIFNEEPYFAITRSSSAPLAGIYRGDRIRIACYALCIREWLDLPAEGGLIEYIPSGESRLCRPEPRDRRAMFTGIRSARKVLSGEVPRKPVRAPCTSCPYEGQCIPGAQRFSDIM
jgi:CRISPR-associated exonuclease Cas4